MTTMKMLSISLAMFCLSSLLSPVTHAKSENLPATTYQAPHHSGTLIVSKSGSVSISTVGTNYHICEAQGKVVGNTIVLNSEGEACKLKWKLQGNVLTLDEFKKDDACHQEFCGARNSLLGEYRIVSEQCRNGAAAPRKTFKKLYDKKQYSQAEAMLKPVINTCKKDLSMFDQAAIRNDLAVTYAHLKDFASCKVVLEPYIAYAHDPEKADFPEGFEIYGPSELVIMNENYLTAIKTNMRLCGIK
jgi:hypothetical protein